MPFDTMTMAAIADELADQAVGGQIQRIIQPSASAVALAIYAHGQQRWLVCSADAQYARVAFAHAKLAKAFATPSSYVMLLRKHLEGTRLRGAEQVHEERILSLTCAAPGRAVRLITEVMGKHSNVVLVDEDDAVLGAIKIVPPRQSRVRPILPGHPYRPPPAHPRDPTIFLPGPRLDPFEFRDHLRGVLRLCAPGTDLRSALLGILPGCSPFMADEILLRAGVHQPALIENADLEAVLSSARDLYGRLRTRTWEPTTFINARGRWDFSALPPAGGSQVTTANSMSDAVDACWGQAETRDALEVTRRALMSEIERALRTAARRVASLRQGLAASVDADEVKERGQLILAYQYLLEPRASELAIPDLERTIALDPKLTPSENAERVFRRYRKLRDAATRLPEMVAEAEAEYDRIVELRVFAQLADSEGALKDMHREISPAPPTPPNSKQKNRTKRGPLRFRLGDSIAIVGRNARENEEVTFRLANRDDLWLHTRGRTGAHVVLRAGQEGPSDGLLTAAAQLAAYYSEGRHDSRVDVDIAAARDIRKVPGGPPGLVTVRHERTLTISPGIDGWTLERTGGR